MNLDTAPPLTPRIPDGISADRLLTSNLAALSACDLDLAKRVAQAKPETGRGEILVRPAASGWPTVVAGPVHIHSAYDPIAEAEVQAARVPREAGRVMALGFGAGHLLAVMLQRQELQRLDVVSLHAGVLRAVAGAIDLRPLLCDPRLRIVPDDRMQLAEPFVTVPALLRLAEPLCSDLRDAAWDALAVDYSRERFKLEEARVEANLRDNAALIAADPPVGRLEGQHRGAAVLIAEAGPSLSMHLPMLQKLVGGAGRSRARLVLIAVDTAVPTLLSQGVVPDYVTTLDSHPDRHLLFRGVLPTSSALIYVPSVSHRVLQSWSGGRYVASAKGHPLFAGLRESHPGSDLWSEGHALHLAVDLARLCGAAGVVLLGADLGLPGAAVPEADPAGEPGTRPWQRKVPAVGGGQLPASSEHIACRRGLEAYIVQHPGLPLYNTSPAGARIAGTGEMTLSRALNKLKVPE